VGVGPHEQQKDDNQETTSSNQLMIIVYGADWCEDTRRSLRHLRRLGVSHRYVNVDEDLEALHRAMALNGETRRTPTIDLGLAVPPLIEPDNDLLTGALVEIDMLSQEDAYERLDVQNVGDFDRVLRTTAGAAVWLAGNLAPRPARWPVRAAGAALVLSGVIGWCPAYRVAGTSSIDGPGDRPDEARRATWLSPRRRRQLTDPGHRLGEAARSERDLPARPSARAKASR
jgi:glutaredoxin